MTSKGPLPPGKATLNGTTTREFQFLNLTESLEVDDLSRFAIRVHSQRDSYRRRKEQPLSKRGNEDGSKQGVRSKPESSPHLQRFRLVAGGLQATRRQPKAKFTNSDTSHHTALGKGSGFLSEGHIPIRGKIGKSGPREWRSDSGESVESNGSRVLDLNYPTEIEHAPLPPEWQEMLWQPQSRGWGGSVFQGLGFYPIVRDLDPFDTLPMRMSGRNKLLLNQLFMRVSSPSPMAEYRTAFFSFAIADEAFFHVALSYSAGDITLTMKKGDSTEAVLHRVEAISLISQRLGMPEGRISDGTIGAVAVLANYEFSVGSVSAAKSHLRGLERMVQMRGGLQNAALSPSLRQLIMWAGISAANISSCPLLFANDNGLPDLDIIAQRSGRSPITAEENISAEPELFEHRIMTYIFGELHHLSCLKASAKFESTNPIDGINYSDKVYLLQRALILFVSSTDARIQLIDKACAVAAQIYIQTSLCDVSFDSRMVESLVERLQQCMEQIQLDFILSFAEEINATMRKALWASFIGAVSVKGKPSGAWFLTWLRAISASLFSATGSPISMTQILKTVLWDDSLEECSRLLWWEIIRSEL